MPAADGASGAVVTVDEHTTIPVETVGPDEPLPVVAERMGVGEFSHLLATDADGDGVGVLTIADLPGALSVRRGRPPAQREMEAEGVASGR